MESIFFSMCDALVNPTSDLRRRLGAPCTQPIFDRIDIIRGGNGHTFMSSNRVHANVRRQCRNQQLVASIDDFEKIIDKVEDRGRIKVTQVQVVDGLFTDMKGYLEQS